MKQCNVEAKKQKHLFPLNVTRRTEHACSQSSKRKKMEWLVCYHMHHQYLHIFSHRNRASDGCQLHHPALKKKKIIFGCTGFCCWGLSLVSVRRGCSLVVMHGLLIAVAFLVSEHRLLILGSIVMVHRPSHLRGMWDLPGLGIKPVSPALQGRFPTTGPPGKPTRSPLKGILDINWQYSYSASIFFSRGFTILSLEENVIA